MHLARHSLIASFLILALIVSAAFSTISAQQPAKSVKRATKSAKAAKRAAKTEPAQAFTLTDPNVVQRQETYKQLGGVTLKIDIFEPKQKDPAKQYPAIVFFFGGGWANGLPKQFYHHCEYLAGRGMIAMSADYRVRSRQPATTPVECVKDAKSAVRWVRANATRLGVDPSRIAAGGGSAGGHIAACSATAPGTEEEGEDASVSCLPDALLLFNPFIGGETPDLDARVNQMPKAILPFQNVKAGLPPTVIFFGSNDKVIPVPVAKAFQSKMKESGNRCELCIYEGQSHGFFNYEREGHVYYMKTLADADKFLVSLGWIEPKIAK